MENVNWLHPQGEPDSAWEMVDAEHVTTSFMAFDGVYLEKRAVVLAELMRDRIACNRVLTAADRVLDQVSEAIHSAAVAACDATVSAPATREQWSHARTLALDMEARAGDCAWLSTAAEAMEGLIPQATLDFARAIWGVWQRGYALQDIREDGVLRVWRP